jgi:hypothetical protein
MTQDGSFAPNRYWTPLSTLAITSCQFAETTELVTETETPTTAVANRLGWATTAKRVMHVLMLTVVTMEGVKMENATAWMAIPVMTVEVL